MGREYYDHKGGLRYVCCEKCRVYLTTKDEMISSKFTGQTGPAYLFDKVWNIEQGEMGLREMMTGKHIARDVHCRRCQTRLGWMYELAYREDQRYKEGKTILEKQQIVWVEGLSDGSDAAKFSGEPAALPVNMETNAKVRDLSPHRASSDEATNMTILPNRQLEQRKKERERIRRKPLLMRTHSRESTSGSSRNWQADRLPSDGGGPHRKKVLHDRGGSRLPSSHSGLQSVGAAPFRSPPSQHNSSHNSDDEGSQHRRLPADPELERNFAEALRTQRGLHIREMAGDGNCLFRAVAYHIYADEEMHGEVRRMCLNYMEQNRDHFSQFVTEDFAGYLVRKRRLNTHGNHLEIQSISEIYARPVEIYEYSIDPLNVFSPEPRGSPSNHHPQAPIRLSYHENCHYNAVYDPQNSTFGVGLGLPGPEPGHADRHLLQDAIIRSETAELERVMLEDKLRHSDWQLTEDELAHQIAQTSYIDYLRATGSGQRRASPPLHSKKPSAAASPIASPQRLEPGRHRQPPPSPSQVSPHPGSSRTAEPSRQTTPPPGPSRQDARPGLYEELLAMEAVTNMSPERAEDRLLAQALLLSQQDLYNQSAAGSSRH
ncbi:unnamed protein product, partial [Mesorhabditis spiculigera]